MHQYVVRSCAQKFRVTIILIYAATGLTDKIEEMPLNIYMKHSPSSEAGTYIKPEGSKDPANGHYPESDEFSPYPHIPLFKIDFYYHRSIYS
jgi:hypothetical protein